MMGSSSQRNWAMVLLLGLAMGWGLSEPAEAQQIRGQAVVGRPFGVGRVEVELPPGQLPEGLGLSGLGLVEKDGRALYPVIALRPVRGLLRELLARPQRVTIYFLFQGDQPLHLTVQARTAQSLVVTPIQHPALFQVALRTWWTEYTAPPRALQPKPDSPPLVEDYLKAMLSQRLGLPMPEKPKDESWQAELDHALGLAMSTETVRLQMVRDRMFQRTQLGEKADLPLPEPVAVSELNLPEPVKDVEIEPIALRVPADCAYVRFGNFSNFLWLQDTLAQWGGDLQNLVALRGLDYGVRTRIESQLGLRQSALSRMLGETVISDVAFVGADMFFKEGAAFGLLFQARGNNSFLAADFKRQWAERMQEDKSVTETKVTIDGHDVPLLSSPDGRVRSFWATNGDCHLFTTSKTLARRFLAIESGKGSLGATPEFRHARSLMPLKRNDTIFVYLSDRFFRNVASPSYRIEMVRRLQAQADLELVQLAKLAAATEGRPGGTIEELVTGGYLPTDFGVRPDGSQTVLEEGEARDSLRGHRGAFVPIPDVDVASATPQEADAYRQFAEHYQSQWQRLDPIMVAIRRHALTGNRERVVIDARMTPLARQQYERLTEWVGPADKLQIAPIAGDAVSMQMVMPRQRTFGGLQNIGAPLNPAGQLLPFSALQRLTEGYAGYMGEPGWLARLLDRRLSAPPEAVGYAVGPLGLWRYRDPQVTLYSLQRPVLDRVVPQVQLEETDRLAQFRMRVADVSAGQMTPLLNDLGYSRTVRTSLGNLYLLHTIVAQLHVPGEHAKKAAEMLLDAKLVCPLGGEYVYRTTADGIGYWTSTALENQPTGLLAAKAPEGYQTTPLNWFRGLDADALLTPEALSVHAEIMMQMPDAKK
jgi:hypothetical protein